MIKAILTLRRESKQSTHVDQN
ncbi:unnamed protein product, partial [Aureobasidium pullulans]